MLVKLIFVAAALILSAIILVPTALAFTVTHNPGHYVPKNFIGPIQPTQERVYWLTEDASGHEHLIGGMPVTYNK